jgi:hypothetical protein
MRHYVNSLRVMVGRWMLVGAVAVMLAACNNNTPTPEAGTPQPNNGVAVLTWNTAPDAVIFRMDRQITNDTPFSDLNRIPPCTLYGDGRVVWVNPLQPAGEEVLEALIDDTQFRSFLEYLIRDAKFYDIPDYASMELPPAEQSSVETISLALSDQVTTKRNYKAWPLDVYLTLLDKCKTLSNAPVRVEPSAGWVTVYPAPENSGMPFIDWPATAPFQLAQANADKQAIWLTDAGFRMLWQAQRETQGNIMWRENGLNYQVALQVPLVSRDSPSAPADAATPAP